MKIPRLCKLFGHRWRPVYISGKYHDIKVRFIGAYCERCRKGYDEIVDANKKMTEYIYGTYSSDFWDEESEKEEKERDNER